MSIRVLVEINNDYLNSIENQPEIFVAALTSAIRAGGTCKLKNEKGYMGEAHRKLSQRGANIKHSKHHSDPCPTGVES